MRADPKERRIEVGPGFVRAKECPDCRHTRCGEGCVCNCDAAHAEVEAAWLVSQLTTARAEAKRWEETALAIQRNTKEACAAEYREKVAEWIQSEAERTVERDAARAEVAALREALSNLESKLITHFCDDEYNCEDLDDWIDPIRAALSSPSEAAKAWEREIREDAVRPWQLVCAGIPSSSFDGQLLDSMRPEHVRDGLQIHYAEIRAKALEQAATVVEDTDIVTYGSYYHEDNARSTLCNAAAAIRALIGGAA